MTEWVNEWMRVVIYRKKSRLFHKSGRLIFCFWHVTPKKSQRSCPTSCSKSGICESKNEKNTTLTYDESQKLRVTSEQCSEVTRSFHNGKKVGTKGYLKNQVLKLGLFWNQRSASCRALWHGVGMRARGRGDCYAHFYATARSKHHRRLLFRNGIEMRQVWS